MAGCWRLAVPDVTFSGGAGSVLQYDLAQRALLVTEEAEHACGKPLGVGERGRCPLHPDGVHHVQCDARRIRCLRHRDRGGGGGEGWGGLGRPASCCAASTGSCGRRRCRCWRPIRWIVSAPAGASHQMTPPPDPASPRLRSGQRLDVHTRAGSEGGCGPSRRSCWGAAGWSAVAPATSASGVGCRGRDEWSGSTPIRTRRPVMAVGAGAVWQVR